VVETLLLQFHNSGETFYCLVGLSVVEERMSIAPDDLKVTFHVLSFRCFEVMLEAVIESFSDVERCITPCWINQTCLSHFLGGTELSSGVSQALVD
jgi:hypothetical protein